MPKHSLQCTPAASSRPNDVIGQQLPCCCPMPLTDEDVTNMCLVNMCRNELEQFGRNLGFVCQLTKHMLTPRSQPLLFFLLARAPALGAPALMLTIPWRESTCDKVLGVLCTLESPAARITSSPSRTLDIFTHCWPTFLPKHLAANEPEDGPTISKPRPRSIRSTRAKGLTCPWSAIAHS